MSLLSTYTPVDVIAGDSDIRAITVTCLTATVPAFTPMKRTTDKSVIPATSVADAIIGISASTGILSNDIQGFTAATNNQMSIYTDIDIFEKVINWALVTDASTNDAKTSAFDRCGVHLVFTTGTGW